VLSTVTHLNGYVMELGFVGTDEVLEPTDTHRLFSIDRNDWVPAGELKVGDSLKTISGELEIDSITFKRGIHRVYNIEVETDHCYYVSDEEILSHNENPCAAPKRTPQQRGRDMETSVLEDLGLDKNKTKVSGTEGNSIPDFVTDDAIGEIKNTKRVTDSKQLRIQREAAQREGKVHVIVTGTNTPVSKTVQRGSKIIRRDDLDVP
ncbi:MAG: putative toxin, partial [Cyanobacteria bacterium P01_F01_bin.3]